MRGFGKKGDGHTDGWTYGQSDQRLVRELLYATKIMKIWNYNSELLSWIHSFQFPFWAEMDVSYFSFLFVEAT